MYLLNGKRIFLSWRDKDVWNEARSKKYYKEHKLKQCNRY